MNTSIPHSFFLALVLVAALVAALATPATGESAGARDHGRRPGQEDRFTKEEGLALRCCPDGARLFPPALPHRLWDEDICESSAGLLRSPRVLFRRPLNLKCFHPPPLQPPRSHS